MALSQDAFDGIDVAMFDVPDEVSAAVGAAAASRGAVAVDNSGAFRMDPEVPLVVPEINPEQLANRAQGDHRERELHHAVHDRGSGRAAPGVRAHRDGRRLLPGGLRSRARRASTRFTRQLDKVAGTRSLGQRAGDVRAVVGDLGPFPAPLAMNVVPWAGSLKADGWSSEELKIRNESRKILGLPLLRVSATCVRVPVVTTHSVAVHATFSQPVRREDAWQVLRAAPGVVVADDPAAGEFPTPVDVVGTDPSWVGRVRQSLDDPCTIELLRLRRQPAQGRGAEHRADRGAGGGRIRGPLVTGGRSLPVRFVDAAAGAVRVRRWLAVPGGQTGFRGRVLISAAATVVLATMIASVRTAPRLQIRGAPPWPAPAQVATGTREARLPLLAASGVVVRYAVHLDVIADGRPVTVPARSASTTVTTSSPRCTPGTRRGSCTSRRIPTAAFSRSGSSSTNGRWPWPRTASAGCGAIGWRFTSTGRGWRATRVRSCSRRISRSPSPIVRARCASRRVTPSRQGYSG